MRKRLYIEDAADGRKRKRLSGKQRPQVNYGFPKSPDRHYRGFGGIAREKCTAFRQDNGNPVLN